MSRKEGMGSGTEWYNNRIYRNSVGAGSILSVEHLQVLSPALQIRKGGKEEERKRERNSVTNLEKTIKVMHSNLCLHAGISCVASQIHISPVFA